MSGDLDVQARESSRLDDNVEGSSSECVNAERLEWAGGPVPFSYQSRCAPAYGDEDGSTDVEPEVPNWLWFLLAGMNPLKGVGPAVTDGIIDAAAQAAAKDGKKAAKGKKDASAGATPAARKAGKPAVLSPEQWIDAIKHLLDYKNPVATLAMVKRTAGVTLNRATLMRKKAMYLEAKERAAAQAKGGQSSPPQRQGASDWNDDWSVIAADKNRGKP